MRPKTRKNYLFPISIILIAFLVGIILIQIRPIRQFVFTPFLIPLSLINNFINGYMSSNCVDTNRVTVPKSETRSMTIDEIANMMSKKLLDGYKSETECRDWRLKDYQIKEVGEAALAAEDTGIITDEGKNIKFLLTFWAKPYNKNSEYWMGPKGQAGWMDQALWETIEDKGDFYELSGGGTGP